MTVRSKKIPLKTSHSPFSLLFYHVRHSHVRTVVSTDPKLHRLTAPTATTVHTRPQAPRNPKADHLKVITNKQAIKQSNPVEQKYRTRHRQGRMKRGAGFDISGTLDKIRKLNDDTRHQQQQQQRGGGGHANTKTTKFLSEPVIDITSSISQFLNDIRNYAVGQQSQGTTQHFEVEARIGVLHTGPTRVTSSGAKTDHSTGRIIPAFVCPMIPTVAMKSGVSRRHYKQRAEAGLVSDSAIALALCVPRGSSSGSTNTSGSKSSSTVSAIEVTRYVETNVAYSNNKRLVLEGHFDVHLRPGSPLDPPGKWESKTRIMNKDYIIPAASYDLRVSLASEKTTDQVSNLPSSLEPINHRVKDRASYKRTDGQNPWQIDVTRVTSTDLRKNSSNKRTAIVYEIEMELQPIFMDQIMKESSPERVHNMLLFAAEKLWDIMQHLNPLEETIDVEEKLEPHPNSKAVSLALATCSALKKFMDDGQPSRFMWPILTGNSSGLPSLRQLPGAMPVNFHRADMEKVQVSPDSDYYLSEKTDGVRHFMIFTGDSVVLVDRALNTKRPKAIVTATVNGSSDSMAHLVKMVQPGTVLDGEVVMHRGISSKLAADCGHGAISQHEARPIFAVFDVMMVGGTPILHLKFEERFKALREASFCRNPKLDSGNVFPTSVSDMSVALPLVRKRFVHRRQIGDLFNCVVEEKGFRSYRQLPLYNHLTDGVIFQPNTPYKCGTDHDLSKWKYPDTATIDVKLLEHHVYRSQFPAHRSNTDDDDNDGLDIFPVVACQDSVVVDKKRFIHLPKSELYRLNADRLEMKKNIAEVGMDPQSGEWYYLTMRPDKTDANHISTVMGTTYELAEGLDWKELQYTMQLRSGEPNLWSMEQSKMDDVLMETQRLKHKKMDSRKK